MELSFQSGTQFGVLSEWGLGSNLVSLEPDLGDALVVVRIKNAVKR